MVNKPLMRPYLLGVAFGVEHQMLRLGCLRPNHLKVGFPGQKIGKNIVYLEVDFAILEDNGSNFKTKVQNVFFCFERSPAETGSFPTSKWLFGMLSFLPNQGNDFNEFAKFGSWTKISTTDI